MLKFNQFPNAGDSLIERCLPSVALMGAWNIFEPMYLITSGNIDGQSLFEKFAYLITFEMGKFAQKRFVPHLIKKFKKKPAYSNVSIFYFIERVSVFGTNFAAKSWMTKILKSKHKLAYSNILLLIFIHFAEHQHVSTNLIQKVNSKNIEKKAASKP